MKVIKMLFYGSELKNNQSLEDLTLSIFKFHSRLKERCSKGYKPVTKKNGGQ